MAPFTPMAERFDTLSDLRSAIHITYSLPEVLFIVYASILSGYEEWESMEDFAKYNIWVFRSHPATDSGNIRPPIPLVSGH